MHIKGRLFVLVEYFHGMAGTGGAVSLKQLVDFPLGTKDLDSITEIHGCQLSLSVVVVGCRRRLSSLVIVVSCRRRGWAGWLHKV